MPVSVLLPKVHITFISLLLTTSGCGQIKTLSPAERLTPEEKLEYLVLKAAAPGAARTFLTLGTPQSRADYITWFWQERSPLEHDILLRRAEKAKAVFGTIDLLGDERIPVYIRYGPPRREEYAPRAVTTETSRIFVKPAEIWTYDSLGLQFDFVKTGIAFRVVGINRFGSNWFPSALEPVDYGKPPPKPAPDARTLDFTFNLYRLTQHNDTVTVELHYGIAGNDPALSPEQQNLIHLHFEFQAQKQGKPIVTTAGWFGCTPLPLPDSTTDVITSTFVPPVRIVGRQVFQLPLDVYTVSASAITIDGKAYTRRHKQLNLIDYVRRAQPGSDLVFYALIDSTFQSPQFERPDWRRVIPLVVPEIHSGGTFYLLYEIYNLTVDSLKQYWIEANYELIKLPQYQAVVVPTPTRFISGKGSTAVVVERLHTMDLNPGDYLVTARVQDLNSNRSTAITASFKILKHQRPH